MEERKDHLWKVAEEAEQRLDDLDKTTQPMGLDVGTAKVAVARRKGKNIETAWQLNAFIPVPYSRFTESTLGQNDISYYRDGEELVIYGTATARFANMFNADTRRPMADGLINPKERLAMPVLEGALERSVDLAAAMDSRGYGRTTDDSRVSRRVTGVLVFGGLLGVCVGIYGLLDGTASTWLGLPMLAFGMAVAAGGLHLGGRRSGRTRYRPDPWALPEWLVTASGVVAATAVFVDVRLHPEDFFLASVTAVPPVPVLAVAGILVGVLPAFVAPPLPAASAPASPPSASGDDSAVATDRTGVAA